MIDVQALNTQRLSLLLPELTKRANEFLDDCSAEGVTLLITQGLRTWQEQDALFAQGRTDPGKIVTNARGGQSYHNFGLAFDIVPLDAQNQPIWDTTNDAWKIAQEIGLLHAGSSDSRLDPSFVASVSAQDLGLTWGGTFTTIKDIPHYELTGGVPLSVLRNLYKPNDLSACWAEVQSRL